MNQQHYYAVLETSLGWFGVLATHIGIRRIVLPKGTAIDAVTGLGPQLDKAQLDQTRFRDLGTQIDKYLNGALKSFTIPMDIDNYSPFFLRAWEACSSIPFGETRSYRWLATHAGNASALRAAGQAMARNPLPLLIPCHRVISSNGDLHGYVGGLDMKRHLLGLEWQVTSAI
mgnify:CR=1 FL=1